MEVARMDEDTVLKTAEAYKAFKGSNPLASANLIEHSYIGITNGFEPLE
jgi:hypothetical protein